MIRMESHQDGDVVVLAVHGEIDGAQAPVLGRELEGLLDDGHRKVVLHLAGVGFVGSAGLGALLKTYKRVESAGGGMCLAEPTRFMRRTLSAMGLDDVLPVRDSVAAGVEFLGGGEAAP